VAVTFLFRGVGLSLAKMSSVPKQSDFLVRTWEYKSELDQEILLSLAKTLSACDFNRIRRCHPLAKRDSTRT